MDIDSGIVCEECGLCWSPLPEDYPALRDDEYLICSCGALLCRKSELTGEAPSIIQPAP
ncbi:MAG: hypothetical protein P8Y60_14525 [Calditrichota bacterium]